MNEIIQDMKSYDAYKNVIQAFHQKGHHLLYGLSGSQKVFFAALALHEKMKPMVVVVKDKEEKALWERDLSLWLPFAEVMSFPVIDKLHFAVTAKSLENQVLQMRALGSLLRHKPKIVLATVEEVSQKNLKPRLLTGSCFNFKYGYLYREKKFAGKIGIFGI